MLLNTSHVYQIKNSPWSKVYLSDQIRIQFASWVDTAKIHAIGAKFAWVHPKPVLGVSNTFVFVISEKVIENLIKIANGLIGLKEVLVAEPNIVVQEMHYKPHSPLYIQQWYLNHNAGNQAVIPSGLVTKRWMDLVAVLAAQQLRKAVADS